MHYMPAIQRVLTIIQKGLKDRLTVNGEILRLNKELSTRTRELQDQNGQLGAILEPVTARSNSSLRESISSIVSADRSLSSGTFAGTPGSSPASSIDLPSNSSQKPPPRYGLNGYTKPRAVSTNRGPPISVNNRRISLQPQMNRPNTPLSAGMMSRRSASPAPPSVYQQGHYRPPVVPLPPRRAETPSDRPRWSSTVRPSSTTTANKRASITPSSYYRLGPRSASTSTTLPLRSPLSRQATSSPLPPANSNLTQRHSHSHLRSFADRVKSPTPHEGGLLGPVPYSKSRNNSHPLSNTIRSPSSLANRTSIILETPPMARPPSSLRSSRMASGLPQRAASPIHHAATSPQMNSLDAMIKSSPREVQRDMSITSEDASIPNDEDPEADSPDDERSTELASSPLSRKTITRPPSSASSARGKRVSMLPVPRGTRSSSFSRK